MESIKNVIEIIKKPSNQFEYEEHYYYKSIRISDHTEIGMTGDIWEAQRFENINSNEAKAWCGFLKTILGKRYEINIKTISLSYNL